MADRKQPPKGPDTPGQEPDGPESKRPQHRPHGREHQVHKEILERRFRGGPQPTPDAYERALEQWKNLPGSVVRPPTDVKGPPAETPPELPDKDSSETNE